MKNSILSPLSIIILAASVVFGSIWIGNSVEKYANNQNNITRLENKALLTSEQAAEYLNISNEMFENILLKDSNEKTNLKNNRVSSYETYKFVPYLVIDGYGKMFSRKELDEWIKYKIQHTQ